MFITIYCIDNHAVSLEIELPFVYHISNKQNNTLGSTHQVVWRLMTLNLCSAFRKSVTACADADNFVKGGPTLTILFSVDEGNETPNTTISGPSSARQRNAILMAFRWHADDGPTLNVGLVDL